MNGASKSNFIPTVGVAAVGVVGLQVPGLISCSEVASLDSGYLISATKFVDGAMRGC